MSDTLKRAEQYDQSGSSIEWCERLHISLQGNVVGIGRLEEILLTGTCFCIIHEKGTIPRVDVYSNGVRVFYKQFDFDANGRVIKNMMYEPDGKGSWHCVSSIWYYTYDERSGRRTKKLMKEANANFGRELTYSEQGIVTKEVIVTDNATPYVSYTSAYKVLEHSPDGNTLLREYWYDRNNSLMNRIHYSSL